MMTHVLLAYLSDEFDEADVAAVRDHVAELARTHAWAYRAPSFVDELTDVVATRPEDEPIRTVGVALPVVEGTGEAMPPRRDIEAFVEGLTRLSRSRGVELELVLGDTYVGDIRAGVMSRSIHEGLIARW